MRKFILAILIGDEIPTKLLGCTIGFLLLCCAYAFAQQSPSQLAIAIDSAVNNMAVSIEQFQNSDAAQKAEIADLKKQLAAQKAEIADLKKQLSEKSDEFEKQKHRKDE